MPRWTCPQCEREFGRAHQGHVCVPGLTVVQLFERRDRMQRTIYDGILRHVQTLGPVHQDVVSVGVFLKADRKLAEIRPRSKDVQLGLYLPAVISSPRILRVLNPGSARVIHLLAVQNATEVDDELRNWLTVAYQHNSDA